MIRKYKVTFIERYSYDVQVEADKDSDNYDIEDIAIDKAFAHYEADKRYPVASLAYDDVEVERIDEDEICY